MGGASESTSQKWYSRERLWLFGVLALAVSVRLIGITQPFVDYWSWRQSLLAMIAENFYNNGFNIFYPQVNYGGSAAGYVGMEFPLLPFIGSLVYLFVGVRDWVGRAISVAFFAAALPFLYLLVKKASNHRSALFAVAIFSVIPLSVCSSRAFMPDMVTLSLSIAAVYLFAKWIEEPERRSLLIATILTTMLAVLIKLPSGLIAIPFLYLALHRRGMAVFRQSGIWVLGISCAVVAVAWYSHAYRVGVSEFPLEVWGLQHSPVSVTLADFMNAVRSALGPGITPIVSGAMLIGFFAPFRPEFRFLFHWWLLAVVIFWVIAGRGFVMHSWYGLPIAPVAAALAGRACDLVANALEKTTGSRLLSLSTVGACFVGMAFFSWGYSYPHYTSWANPYREAGLEVRKMASPGDLVTFADTGDPTGIYYSGRKGCLFYAPADNDRAIQQLNDLRNEGVRYLVFTRYARWWLNDLPDFRRHLESAHTRVVEQGDYTVFHLAPPDPSVRLTRVRSGAGSGRAAGQSDTRCGCTAFGFECPSTEPSPLRRAR